MNKSVWVWAVLTLLLNCPPGVLGATAGGDQPRVLWSYTTGGAVTGVAISADGSLLAASSEDGFLYGLNRTGSQLWNLSTESLLQAVDMTPGGDRIVAGDETELYLLRGEGDVVWKRTLLNIEDVGISHGGDRIVTGTSDRFVRVFNDRGGEIWRYNTEFSVQGVGISGDGRLVAAGAADGHVYCFDQGGSLVWEYNTRKFINDVEVVGDVVVVTMEGSRLILLKDGREERTKYYQGEPLGLGVSPDGDLLAVGLTDGTVYSLDGRFMNLWHIDTGSPVYAADVSSGGSYLVVGAGRQVKLVASPDEKPPEITFLSPRDGDVVSGTVTIDASFNEEVEKIEIEIDGAFAGGSLPRNWTTTTYPQGNHTITIRATDIFGNPTEESIEVFIGGAPAPTPLPTTPATGGETGKGEVNATVGEGEEAVEEVPPSPEDTSAPLIPDIPRRRSPIKAIVILAVIVLALALAYRSTTQRRERKYRWKGR